MNPSKESKKLAIKLRANEDNYITGHYDLNETLDETERLWNQVKRKKHDEITANEILPDSDLMKLQTRLAKRSAKNYKPDSLVFNPTEFATKLKQYYDQSSTQDSQIDTSQNQVKELFWMKMGDVAKKLINVVPSFAFINGTFDPEPVEIVKKKRKVTPRDKLGKATQPESMSMSENKDSQDQMIKEAERVLGILQQLLKINGEKGVCFYEFVTDPNSFGRTVENIFILSLLVKEGLVRIMKDESRLPFLTTVNENERKLVLPSDTKQCIMSISMEEWRQIVLAFKIEKAIIQPPKTTKRN